jgi:hypothetical protein
VDVGEELEDQRPPCEAGMEPAWAVILAVLAAALPSLLLVLILYSYSRRLWRQYFVTEPEPVPIDRRDAALKRSALMASLWRSSIPLRAFQWSEHPSHVITALEHGWPAFAFSYAASAMGAFAGPVHQMWEMCASCSSMKFCAPEITWTTSQEECMQQVSIVALAVLNQSFKSHLKCLNLQELKK